MAPHRSDFTFRTGMFDAEPPVRGGQPQRITAQRWHEVRVELTTASATYWVVISPDSGPAHPHFRFLAARAVLPRAVRTG